MRIWNILMALFGICALFMGCSAKMDDGSHGGFVKTEGDTHCETREADSTTEEETMREVFDYNRKKKPSENDIVLVSSGMSFYEVCEVLGKPHGTLPQVSHSFSYIWETTEGNTYAILFLPKESVPNIGAIDLYEYHKYTIAMSDPELVR